MYTAAEAILGASYQNPTLHSWGSYHHHTWHLGRTYGIFGLQIDTWRIQPLSLLWGCLGLDKRRKEKQANVDLKERMFMKRYIMSVEVNIGQFPKELHLHSVCWDDRDRKRETRFHHDTLLEGSWHSGCCLISFLGSYSFKYWLWSFFSPLNMPNTS